MRVLVTGTSGFVGRHLVKRCLNDGWQVTALTRQTASGVTPELKTHVIAGMEQLGDVSGALQGQDVVVHCAARVHVMKEQCGDPLAAFRAVNVAGTLELARQAADAGVKRFIFLSTIGVNGSLTASRPFTSLDKARPHSPYAISKHEAELCLARLSQDSGMEFVVIRPPLVHGFDAPGNFRSLMRWVHRGVPLPLGRLKNYRSLVGVDNLVDLIATCAIHPAAANQTFLVSDGEDISTSDLLVRVGVGLGVDVRLFFVPKFVLNGGAVLVGRRSVFEQLCRSLQVDTVDLSRRIGWIPPVSLDEGIERAAQGYLRETCR